MVKIWSKLPDFGAQFLLTALHKWSKLGQTSQILVLSFCQLPKQNGQNWLKFPRFWSTVFANYRNKMVKTGSNFPDFGPQFLLIAETKWSKLGQISQILVLSFC